MFSLGSWGVTLNLTDKMLGYRFGISWVLVMYLSD